MPKTDLRAAILRQLHEELARQTNAAELARDEAISEESRAQNKWDTHSQEAAYLAEGQARLAAEIGSSIEVYGTLPLPDFSATDPVALGALVTLAAPGAASPPVWYLLGPRAGGLELAWEGKTVLVLTPQSPLGRQLLGKRIGDVIASGPRGAAQTIVAIA